MLAAIAFPRDLVPVLGLVLGLVLGPMLVLVLVLGQPDQFSFI